MVNGPVSPARPIAYCLALCLITGLDYFDNTLFSYFASTIAGGINASPDEIVWAASSYAGAAVFGILMQQWWVDRVGNKPYFAACMLVYAAGAVLSACTNSPIELMLTRAVQGYAIGPIMGACRIILQDGGLPTAIRVKSRRGFLLSIVSSMAIAPIIGGSLLARFEWRALFVCMAPPALLLFAFVLYAVPSHGRRDDLDDEDVDLWPYLAFAVSQGALQVLLQQLHFQLFTSSAVMAGLLLVGLGGLAYFAFHQWRHPHPLVHLRGLRDKTYVAGLMLYAFYYYLATTFGYLLMRFLEQGLGYPVENAGWFIGVTGLTSIPMLAIYYRYSAKVTRKKWLMVPGFCLAALAAWLMSRMTPDASQSWLVPPMLLRGMMVMFIAVPVANLAFRQFELDDFAHSYRLKNIVRQLVLSFATSSIIVLERHREALHYARLAEAMPRVMQNTLLDQWTRAAQAAGQNGNIAAASAIARLSDMVSRQANLMAVLDGFAFLALLGLAAALVTLWQKRIN